MLPKRPGAKLRRAQPASGSFIDNFIGAESSSLFCEIDECDLVQTLWLLFTKDDMRMGHPPRTVLKDIRFNLTGDVVVLSGSSIRLNTNLTIVRMTSELDGAIIYCYAADSHFLANFTLRAYSESVSVHYICNLRLKTIYRILCISYLCQREYCSPHHRYYSLLNTSPSSE